MRVRVLLPFILSLAFVAPALPCPGAGCISPAEPGFPGQTITADFGPPPLAPARSDSGSSTASAASIWAAPGSAIELLPLPVEAAPFVAADDVPRKGFPRGVDRPPKSSS